MNYDDNFETVDELLNAINEALQEKMETDYTVTAEPCNRYLFDKVDTAYEDISEDICEDISEIIDNLDQMIEEKTALYH